MGAVSRYVASSLVDAVLSTCVCHHATHRAVTFFMWVRIAAPGTPMWPALVWREDCLPESLWRDLKVAQRKACGFAARRSRNRPFQAPDIEDESSRGPTKPPKKAAVTFFEDGWSGYGILHTL